MAASGLEIVGGTPQHLQTVLANDVAKWKKVVTAANIKL
jgi:tripartite-type tricarboxylate transporter receptor subunit TctC